MGVHFGPAGQLAIRRQANVGLWPGGWGFRNETQRSGKVRGGVLERVVKWG